MRDCGYLLAWLLVAVENWNASHDPLGLGTAGRDGST
jgi:hypothetical protein